MEFTGAGQTQMCDYWVGILKMHRVLLATLVSCILGSNASATSPETALQYLKTVEKAQALREQGTAFLTAYGRGVDAFQVHRICTDGTLAENDKLLASGQEIWKVNPSLKSCCATFGSAYLPGSVAGILTPFLGLSLPERPKAKMSDLRIEAAEYVADKLLNYPVGKIVDLVDQTSAESVEKTLSICEPALEFESRSN